MLFQAINIHLITLVRQFSITTFDYPRVHGFEFGPKTRPENQPNWKWKVPLFFLTSNVGMQLVRNPDNYITHENVTTQQNAYLAVLSSNSDIIIISRDESSKTCSQMVNTQRNPALALDLFKLLSLQNQGTSFIPIGQTNTFRLDFQPVTLTCCSLSQAASNWLYVRSHVEQHTDITQLD